MPNLRVMTVFANRSGLSEDRIVNTWHFVSTSGADEAGDFIIPALESFYNDGFPEASSQSLAKYMSPVIDRGTNKSQFRVYDLADPEPREPAVYPWTLGVTTATGKVPNEVALTLSFYSDRNIPRRRGRLFLGPLNDDLVGQEASDARPASTVCAGIVRAAGVIAGIAEPSPFKWVVRSTTDGAFYPVTDVWMDNAFDTIRKRGADPTVRSRWPV